jgi:hypothetical protein
MFEYLLPDFRHSRPAFDTGEEIGHKAGFAELFKYSRFASCGRARMYTYIDLFFSPDGTDPMVVADRLREAASLSFIVGPHDILFEWRTVEEFRAQLAKVHAALAGTGVTYRVQSVEDTPAFVEPVSWPPALIRTPEHPAYSGSGK